MCTLPEDDINSAALIMRLYVYCLYFIIFGQYPCMLEKCGIISILLILLKPFVRKYTFLQRCFFQETIHHTIILSSSMF